MRQIKKAKHKKYKELYAKLRDFLDDHFDNFSQESSFEYTNRVIDLRKRSTKTYNMDNFRISCVIEEYEPSDEDDWSVYTRQLPSFFSPAAPRFPQNLPQSQPI